MFVLPVAAAGDVIPASGLPADELMLASGSPADEVMLASGSPADEVIIGVWFTCCCCCVFSWFCVRFVGYDYDGRITKYFVSGIFVF